MEQNLLTGLALFALVSSVTPGPNNMMLMASGANFGFRRTIPHMMGVVLGFTLMVALVGVGLMGAFQALPWLHDVLTWAGIAYLLWLAVQTLRGGAARQDLALRPSAFRGALIVSLTNPKVILFVLAFVPQFVKPEAGPVLVQFLVFGLILAVGGFFINGLIGVFAGQAGQRLTGSPVFARWLGRVSAGIFAGLAVRLAIMERA